MYTLRSKGSFPLSFNDHSNLLNERFERNPLRLAPCCACCSCTSLYTYRVPTYPNLLYGLRQSKLLQWSVYGVERYVSRLPTYGVERYLPRQLVYGVNRGCCEVGSCFRERSLCNRSGRRRKRCASCCCRESDKGSVFDYQVGVDEADDILSLLSEGVSEECGGVRTRYGSSYKSLEAGIKRNHDRGERRVSSRTTVQEQEEGDIVSQLNEVKRKLAELESDLKRHHVVRSARREKDGEGSKQQDVLAKCENHKRGDVSSRSSYHSVSSFGDFSSDAEIEDKHTQIEEDLSMGYEKGRGREGKVMGKVVKESARQREYSKRLGESSDQKTLKVEGDVNLNSRKYRESKIAVVMQDMQSWRGSSQKNLEVSRSHDIKGQSASISLKKLDSQERNSSLPMKMDDRKAKQYHENQVIGASALPRFKSTETPESHASYVNMSPGLKETYHGTEEDMETSTTSMQEASDHLKERVSREDDLYVHSVKVISEIEDMNKTSNLSKREDVRRMKLGESQISVQDTDQQLHQSGESSTVCRNVRSKSETLESSWICESNIHHGNDTKIKNMNQKKEKISNLISGSSTKAMEAHGITERMPQRVLSLSESKVVTDKSQLPAGGAETVTLWRTSDEGSMSQDTNSTSSFKSFVDMRDSKCQTDENIREFGSLNVAQPSKASSSSQDASEEASGLQGSLHLRTEVRMKQRKREGSERSIREMVMHPSLLQSRVSAQSEPTTRISSSEVHNETLEGSSSAIFMHSGRNAAFQSEMDSDECGGAYHEPLDTTTPEDSLGSGDQLEKVSSQYVGESAEEVGSERQSAIEAGRSRKTSSMKSVGQEGTCSELASKSSCGDSGAKVRHEGAISKTQRETESSELQLTFEVGKYANLSNTINTDHSLGSTDGLDILSSQAVGDFVDMVSLEVTNSGNRRQAEGSKFQSAVTVGKSWKMSSSHYVSHEGSQFELSSSPSSGSSRATGPPCLKQDMKEPSVPSSLQPARGSAQGGPTTIITRPEVSGGVSESSYSALSLHSGTATALEAETHNADESGRTYVEPLETTHPEDSLGSNDRLEKISSQFIGEFLDKARHEVMVSSNQGEIEGSELQSSAEIDESRNNSSNQYDGQEGTQLEIASTHSSGGSGLKGPSDIMWDVRDPSVPEVSKDEVPIAASNEKAVVKRTSRSFWNIVADIVRLRWGSDADTHNLAGRSGQSSSSEKSAGTEAWYSGNEHEDNVKNSVKTDQTIIPPGPSTSDQLQQRKSFSQSEGKMSETVGSKEMKTPALMRTGTTSESTSASEKVSFGKVNPRTEKVKSSEGLPTGREIVELSLSLPETELPVGGEKEAELKRRKLQRTKQVTRDRFDDWQEAYKLEREQKVIDEVFMREALIEAEKAADVWEVPVGAVLVQHGKIISRGSNLVEELRDSTAHAEMICIREASNLLQTWRLSGTTLYVTLEPCPMCAGAILQARIDAVVWGAPNKLLGADGSWVRLFPDEGDGSESADKPAAPVHPFHPKMKIRRGVLASECADIMQQFFQLRRKKKKVEPSSSHSTLPGSHHPAKLLTKMHDIFHFMFCL